MKSILVIGGNSDIGFELSKEFKNDNYEIFLASRNMEELKIKKKELNDLNVRCQILYIDIEDHNSHDTFLENLNSIPEIVIISCGYLEKNEKNYKKLINTNYSSLVYFIENLLSKKMFFEELKSIIGISSLAGERGKQRLNIYSSAKSGFSNYLDGLRQRLFKDSKNVYTVKPGFVRTKMTKELNLNSYLMVSPKYLSKKIYKNFQKKKFIIYPSLLWRLIIFVYKLIPEKIFIKLKN